MSPDSAEKYTEYTHDGVKQADVFSISKLKSLKKCHKIVIRRAFDRCGADPAKIGTRCTG